MGLFLCFVACASSLIRVSAPWPSQRSLSPRSVASQRAVSLSPRVNCSCIGAVASLPIGLLFSVCARPTLKEGHLQGGGAGCPFQAPLRSGVASTL